MQPLLQLVDASKSFGAVEALKAVSFDLLPGEVHALLGENGAGKSTLIKVITGAHALDGGTLVVAGELLRALTPASARRLGIACVYQQPALFPDLTVTENLALRLESPSAFSRVRWKARQSQGGSLLHRIGARISPDAEVRSLSLPEQQLVEIACALGANTRILIMDEPTASLSQSEVDTLFRILGELRRSGTGIIYISHRLDEIYRLADRVTVLRDGESVGTHPIQKNEPGSKESVLTNPNAITSAKLIELMVGRKGSPGLDSATNQPATGLSHSRSIPDCPLLALRDLGCADAGIRNVTLEIQSGEIVGLAGLVGAGRTELAQVLFGLTPADAGEIRMDGRAVSIRSPSDAKELGIAYLPEDRRRHGIILEMSVASNITMAIHRRIFPGGWLRRGPERALACDFIQRLSVTTTGPEAPCASLSGGNQQKVALARWLAAKPKLLILDEPTQGVDIGAKREIHQLIRNLAREGMAVLMISSDLPEILELSERLAVMRLGTITEILPGGCEASRVMSAALRPLESPAQSRLGTSTNREASPCPPS